MIILGIETSCDETAASVVKGGQKILSHVVASSAEMHIKSGGVIPENAAREQVKSIIPVVQEAIIQSLQTTDYGLQQEKAVDGRPWTVDHIDAIAVTIGPGLIGSLLVGVETAKTLAVVWGKPIVPVNHLVAHIYANWLSPNVTLNDNEGSKRESSSRSDLSQNDIPRLPAVALVVSGGHTNLVLMHDHGKLEYIGGTRDDAAGEAFDKTARLLGLPYPGGPSVAKAASNYSLPTTNYQPFLPRPMINEDNFDFSFSGLKTAVLREVNKLKDNQQFNNATIEQLSFGIQEAITDVLVDKTLRAVKKYGVSTLLLAGGVAANSRLTEKFKLAIGHLAFSINFHVPPPKLCTDNASYIAACAEYNYHPLPWQEITANPSLTIME